MMKQKVYVISLCIKSTFKDKSEFHFKGAYLGKQISKIIVEGGDFTKFDEYLLKVEVQQVIAQTLYVKFLKGRLLNR